jgi:TldD protein
LYDDEGVQARRRYLIKEGIINELLTNRETAAILGTKSNGAARGNGL